MCPVLLVKCFCTHGGVTNANGNSDQTHLGYGPSYTFNCYTVVACCCFRVPVTQPFSDQIGNVQTILHLSVMMVWYWENIHGLSTEDIFANGISNKFSLEKIEM